ncbi:MAG TPA: hypothetical protein VI413_10065 [Paludibacter sp.]
MIKFKIFILIFILIGLTSCKRKIKQDCKDFTIQDYSITIRFSSMWDCGLFKKIILNNKKLEDPRVKDRFKDYKLYTINYKGNCKNANKSDTLIVDLTKLQSDSIFDLANLFIQDFKL